MPLFTDQTDNTIEINDDSTFQSIEGFGYCLTGGSAMLLHNMEQSARTALLNELFSKR